MFQKTRLSDKNSLGIINDSYLYIMIRLIQIIEDLTKPQVKDEEFMGTMFDFRKKYKLCSDVYYLLDGKKKKYKQYKRWVVSYEN